jgi:integrase
MYEFLDIDLKYDSLDEFQKNKADWLQEIKVYSDTTKRTYWLLLNGKVNPQEVIKGKDLYDWDKQEIMKLIKYTPTTKKATKIALYTAITRYMDWACEKGLNYVGNPCDTIDTSELFTINEVALKESYQTLQEFYDFILGLDCTDVDRMMFTLLRYGVSVTDVGTVKWEDVDRENKVLNIHKEDGIKQLPIDNMFILFVDKAKSCHTYVTNRNSKSEEDYLDFGYIVKPHASAIWQHMSDKEVYNKAGRISKTNKILRISVPELNSNRKYDLLFDRLDKNGKITNYDIEEILLMFDGISSNQRSVSLKRDFEAISGIKVERKNKAPHSRKGKLLKNKSIQEVNGLKVDSDGVILEDHQGNNEIAVDSLEKV